MIRIQICYYILSQKFGKFTDRQFTIVEFSSMEDLVATEVLPPSAIKTVAVAFALQRAKRISSAVFSISAFASGLIPVMNSAFSATHSLIRDNAVYFRRAIMDKRNAVSGARYPDIHFLGRFFDMRKFPCR